MRGALGRQVLGQGLPLAARREHVENRVENLAHIDRALASTAPRRRYERSYQRPLGVGEVGGVTKSATIGGKAMFWLPHHQTPLANHSSRKGITTDSFDSTSFRIGS